MIEQPKIVEELRQALNAEDEGYRIAPESWMLKTEHSLDKATMVVREDIPAAKVVRIRAAFDGTQGKFEPELLVANFVALCSPRNIKVLLDYIRTLERLVPEKQEKSPKFFTKDEKKVLQQTADLWNSYCGLHGNASSDADDVMQSIHEIQRVIAMRAARRAAPEFLRQHEA